MHTDVDTMVSMLKTKVAKWGNSIAVRIPDRIVRDAGLVQGGAISVSWNRNKVVIEKLTRTHDALSGLIDRITDKNRHDYAWKGVEPKGAEVWRA